MTPIEFQSAIRKHVAAALDPLPVFYANVKPDQTTGQTPHAWVSFEPLGGGVVGLGGQAKRERYDWQLQVTIRVPLGDSQEPATELVWKVHRAFDSIHQPSGISVEDKPASTDGEINGMWQERAIVNLHFFYSEHHAA